jgi:hypothetical protein
VISSIIHIDHLYDNDSQPWPIEVEDHDGELHTMTLEPGQVRSCARYIPCIQPSKVCTRNSSCRQSLLGWLLLRKLLLHFPSTDAVLRERRLPARAQTDLARQVLCFRLHALPARGPEGVALQDGGRHTVMSLALHNCRAAVILHRSLLFWIVCRCTVPAVEGWYCMYLAHLDNECTAFGSI